MTEYLCDNCGHVDTDATLRLDIPDYSERVDEDGPEPDGECSVCRCLTYRIVLTPVVFRFWQDTVIALFPGTDADGTGRYCDSYQSIGQHSGADAVRIVAESRPATPAEYASLKAELERAPYHYRLAIHKRFNSHHRAAR